MISFNDLTFEFGSRALYNHVDWHIKPKEKIGLIGANGTGKTTLLKILVGDLNPTSGSVSRSRDLKIGYLNQDLLSYQSDYGILHVAMEAFERQNKLHDDIEDLLLKLETDYSDEVLKKLSDKQEEFEALDGYRIQYKAEEILAGLGFTAAQSHKPLKEFSGGWRMRVMLAKILLQQPDLLLLDEPTNHLDLPSIQWLENYLSAFDGAIVIVSHDRYFLDRTVEKIMESRSAKLTPYTGNYSDYIEEKALREEIQKGEFKNQQSKIKQEERLIERFRAKASKAKMVQSRIKALDRLERVDDVDSDLPTVSFKFRFSKQSGRQVVKLENISKEYPGVPILDHADADIEKGDKIALIGANGKGKSTLLRIIAGTETALGKVEQGYNVTKTFFAQHQLESLTLENTILVELQTFAPSYTETELRTLLGCFLFTGDDVFKKIKVLSGGEKSRVALAKALTSDANFLILDEPTNHLDIQSVNILIQALKQYEGSFIVVSHDRYFLSEIANKIWFIDDRKIKAYPGTYSEYEEWETARKKTGVAPAPVVVPAKQVASPKITESKQAANHTGQKASGQAPPVLNQNKKFERDLEELESQIASLENIKRSLEAELSDPTIFSDKAQLAEKNTEYMDTNSRLDALTRRWEEMVEKIS